MLRLQLGKVEAVAPNSKIAKNTFMNFLFTPLCLVFSPRYFKTINRYFELQKKEKKTASKILLVLVNFILSEIELQSTLG